MSKPSGLKNLFALTSGNALAQIIGLGINFWLAKKIGTAGYGVFSFWFIQGMLLSTLADTATRQVMIRNTSSKKILIKEIFFGSLVYRFLLIAVIFSLYYSYNSFSDLMSKHQLIVVFVYAFILGLVFFYESILYGLQRSRYVGLATLSGMLVWLVYLLIFETWIDEFNAITGLIVASIIRLLILVLTTGVRFDLNLMGFGVYHKVVKESVPFFLSILLMLPINYLSINVLEHNADAINVGRFTLAMKLASPFFIVSGYAALVILPRLVQVLKDNIIIAQTFGVTIIRIASCIAVVASGILWLSLGYVVPSIFTEMPGLFRTTEIMVLFYMLFSFNSIIGLYWVASGEDLLLLKVTVISAVISLGFILMLGKSDEYSMSWAYLFSVLLSTSYVIYNVRKTLRYKYGELLSSISYLLIFVLAVAALRFINYPSSSIVSIIVLISVVTLFRDLKHLNIIRSNA